MKEQVLRSPFVEKNFLDLVSEATDPYDVKIENFAIFESSIINIGSREIVDYRPNISIDSKLIKKHKIKNINLDSLHFFQVQDLVKQIKFESVMVKKSDVSVNLSLQDSYEEYLESLTKKNRSSYL